MPYQPHTLVTFGGTLSETGSQDEIWQCGFRGFGADRVDPVLASDLASLALLVLRGPTGAGGGLEGIWTMPSGRIAADAKLVWCKAANIAPDGTYAAEPGIAEMAPLAGPTGQQCPAFCSIALSFSTGRTLGRATHGRVYPPNYATQVMSGSKIALVDQNNLNDWAHLLLDVVDTGAEDPVFHPYVVSKFGVSNEITGVRVGNVYDTQRRRKNANPEIYVESSWSA